ncbi:MAG TPA: glycosyl hydrolase family 79 C-terminal domain-containing protein [Bryobacteraceae bacterium]|nr:glycosyl hydrolase family 79 C-terminal domain-containing protein [Bryobacteraceae bacterium]
MYLNRRSLLAGSVRAAALAFASRGFGIPADPSGGTQSVHINVQTGRTLGTIPADFVGLGYEISSVSQLGLLTAQNQIYVQMVRSLSPSGVIRMGGNTSDYSSFNSEGQAVSAPKATVVNADAIRQLGTFLAATRWKLIWGLNLGSGNEQQAVEEAQAVAAAAGHNLLAFEIGNEPDLFGRKAGHRPTGYGYDDYLAEYRRYKAAIRAKLPNAPFAGPDAASATNWVTRFAADEQNDLKLLTHHYYRECASPTSTLDKLLRPDPKLAPELETLRAASNTSHLPYRFCETNSFCGGGKPGVSDTFGATLWVLDFMFTLASAGCAGVNIETGVNQLGFISSYSPIGDDEHGTYSAMPDYYGMLAFSQASRGRQVALDCEAASENLTAYAVINDHKQLFVTIINKEPSRDADVSITAPEHFATPKALRLTAPSLDSKDGVTLGGSSVNPNGKWTATRLEPLPVKSGQSGVHVPAASAAILIFR